MSWKESLKERNKIILATSSRKGEPHAITVLSLGLVDEKILIGNCLMRTSIKNIRDNNLVSIVANDGETYYRIEGRAEEYSSGKYLDLANEKSKPPMPKTALMIEIKEVFDLSNQKKVS